MQRVNPKISVAGVMASDEHKEGEAIRAPDVWDRRRSDGDEKNEANESSWKTLRFVCISDTHLRHDEHLGNNRIPDGDVLIHSGDFFSRLKRQGDTHKEREESFRVALKMLNEFMCKMPHKVKIFVAGNNEIAFNKYSREKIQALLPDCIYLQDTSVSIANDSIKLYGSPWTTSCNMGFSAREKELVHTWEGIPDDVDILITHLPPFNVLDTAYGNGVPATPCTYCGRKHQNRRHWGSPSLLDRVSQVKPKAHLFGHVHDVVGFSWGPEFTDDSSEFKSKYTPLFLNTNEPTLFVNSAMDMHECPVFFDYHYKEDWRHHKKKASCLGF